MDCLFLRLTDQCMCPTKSFKKLFTWFSVVCGVQLIFLFQIVQFLEDSCLFWCMILSFTKRFSSVEPECVNLCCFGWIVLCSSIKFVVECGSSLVIILKIADSAGLINLDCSRITTESSALCVFILIVSDESIVVVTLTSAFLSNTVDIEWDISKLAVSLILSSGVAAPAVFHSNGWATKTVIIFVAFGGIVRLSSLRTNRGFAPFSLLPL